MECCTMIFVICYVCQLSKQNWLKLEYVCGSSKQHTPTLTHFFIRSKHTTPTRNKFQPPYFIHFIRYDKYPDILGNVLYIFTFGSRTEQTMVYEFVSSSCSCSVLTSNGNIWHSQIAPVSSQCATGNFTSIWAANQILHYPEMDIMSATGFHMHMRCHN